MFQKDEVFSNLKTSIPFEEWLKWFCCNFRQISHMKYEFFYIVNDEKGKKVKKVFPKDENFQI